MEKKPKFLKNLLTTASAIAVIAGGVNSTALGAVVDTAGTPATITAGAGVNLTAIFTDGVDTIRLAGPHDLNTGSAINMAGGGININGNANQTFTVGHAVANYGVDLAMNLILNAGGTITVQDVIGVNNVTVNNGGVLTAARDVSQDLIVTDGGTVTTVRNVTRDVTITGAGVVTAQTGTVGRNLSVAGTGLYGGAVGADVTGTVTINTTNGGNNTLHDAIGAGQHVTVTAGNLVMNDITNAGTDLLANGGVTTIRAVGRDAILRNGAVVNQAGAVGRNLDVGGASLYVGAVGADVTGTVTINTTNGGNNTLHDGDRSRSACYSYSG
ncbi:hypothetical protein Trichorick_01094 [Candidatus Trichorickettsia mobilis]|uniref:Uncharacterized protein n=1 Tax=Candidatus Trichorickettsia mobilis TaxID=1346319 RepID=A0ABZ0UT35_9RICK|nr:hypothetical protein [Candidatus Trichorickettsia mobilis]WPY01189.1 hypothetical protein Trichorick_01094 [Candidatus Trichorickettsia mobilis]